MPKEYQILQRLNTGGQGQVFKVLETKESEFLALKITNFPKKKSSENPDIMLKKFMKEVEIYRLLATKK